VEALVHSAALSGDDQGTAGTRSEDLQIASAIRTGALDCDVRSGIDQDDSLAVSGDSQCEPHYRARRRLRAFPSEKKMQELA
jgi:hypothetical protein